MGARGKVIEEHFGYCCKLQGGDKIYDEHHSGVVLADRLVDAGVAVDALGEKAVRTLVRKELVTPCRYSVDGREEVGYVFVKNVDAENVWGEVLEALD